MYIIECKEIIELYDGSKLIARPDDITIIANEHDNYDWHGSMVVGKNSNAIDILSSRKGFPLLIMFNSNTKNYRGLIRIIDEPKDMGKFYWLEFQGVDLLQAK
ncbi:MAG: hypothetical protein WBZ29_05670 [Methanocella sp.]